jgi:phospholipase/carboxylesterase
MTESEGPYLVTDKQALKSAGLIHRVLEPKRSSPEPSSSAPTVVMLHGRSGNEDAMWIFSRVLPKEWLVVAPRGIKPDPGGGYAWHPRQRDEWPPLAMFDEAVSAVTRFISALPGLYQADPQQIYLMGFSQGAATAYATAMGHPGLVKGVAGLVGFVPVQCDNAIKMAALSRTPIFMAVGKEDPLIPYSRAQRCAQTLRATGADLTYREYGTGHRLNAQGVRDLRAWWQERMITT